MNPEFSFSESYYCDGSDTATELSTKTTYHVPFVLSMSIETKSTSSGTIFRHIEDSSSITIVWRDSKLEFQLMNNNLECCNNGISEGVNMHVTDMLSENIMYDVSLIFDGTKCGFHINGKLVGSEMDCSNGFEIIKSLPLLCSSTGLSFGAIRNKRNIGWNGSVFNFKFQELKSKKVSIYKNFHYIYL